MDVRTCKVCHKLFQYSGYGEIMCPTCKQKDEEDFEKVKKFVQMNPSASGQQISDATGVAIGRIAKWMREERLIISNASGVLVCEQCGKPISAGKLCPECKAKLAQEFASVGLNPNGKRSGLINTAPTPNKETKGMRFINT